MFDDLRTVDPGWHSGLMPTYQTYLLAACTMAAPQAPSVSLERECMLVWLVGTGTHALLSQSH